MLDVSDIADTEILLRRVPPSTQSHQFIKETAQGNFRATSWALQVGSDGVSAGLSCTRLLMTSPRELLAKLPHEATGWQVARIRVSDVRALGLDVIFTPTPEDPGHCEIRGPDGLQFPNKRSSALAKKTRILTDAEVQNLNVGDSLTD